MRDACARRRLRQRSARAEAHAPLPLARDGLRRKRRLAREATSSSGGGGERSWGGLLLRRLWLWLRVWLCDQSNQPHIRVQAQQRRELLLVGGTGTGHGPTLRAALGCRCALCRLLLRGCRFFRPGLPAPLASFFLLQGCPRLGIRDVAQEVIYRLQNPYPRQQAGDRNMVKRSKRVVRRTRNQIERLSM